MIPVNTPIFNGNEIKYLENCISSGWISSEGPYVEQFEKLVAERTGRKYGISVTNGTAAIDAVIQSLNLNPGDEVILPTFTIISCIAQILRSGAIPVFIDANFDSFNMKVEDIESKITSKTKAIMVVHIYGLPVDLNPVLQLANKYNLIVIEDAAEAIGQTYYGKECGGFGDVSTFSFYPNKHITTGEGGMILTDDEDLANKLKSLRNLCFKPETRFIHDELGWNLRMTNIQAAIGVAQFEKMDDHLARKRVIGAIYNNLLKDLPFIQKPLVNTSYANNLYWVYSIVLDPTLGLNSREMMKLLAGVGVGTRPFFYPLHMQPVLKKFGIEPKGEFPNSEKLYEYGFYLPSGLGISNEEIEKVVSSMKNILRDYV